MDTVEIGQPMTPKKQLGGAALWTKEQRRAAQKKWLSKPGVRKKMAEHLVKARAVYAAQVKAGTAKPRGRKPKDETPQVNGHAVAPTDRANTVRWSAYKAAKQEYNALAIRGAQERIKELERELASLRMLAQKLGGTETVTRA